MKVTLIGYEKAAHILKAGESTVRRAVAKGNLIKVEISGKVQQVIEEQVRLFENESQIRKSLLKGDKLETWENYKAVAENYSTYKQTAKTAQQNKEIQAIVVKQAENTDLIQTCNQLGLTFSPNSVEKIIKETSEIISELSGQINSIHQETFLTSAEHHNRIDRIEASIGTILSIEDKNDAIKAVSENVTNIQKMFEQLKQEKMAALELAQKLQSAGKRLQSIEKIIPLIEKTAIDSDSPQLEEAIH